MDDLKIAVSPIVIALIGAVINFVWGCRLEKRSKELDTLEKRLHDVRRKLNLDLARFDEERKAWKRRQLCDIAFLPAHDIDGGEGYIITDPTPAKVDYPIELRQN